MFEKVNVSDWLSLSWETRRKIVEIFKIPRSGGTHVVGGVVKTDGYTQEDLTAISVEKMKEYTKLESDDFVELFKKTIKLVNKQK